MEDYKKKYLEYKIKYIELKKSMEKKNQSGGTFDEIIKKGKTLLAYEAYPDDFAVGSKVIFKLNPTEERIIAGDVDRRFQRLISHPQYRNFPIKHSGKSIAAIMMENKGQIPEYLLDLTFTERNVLPEYIIVRTFDDRPQIIDELKAVISRDRDYKATLTKPLISADNAAAILDDRRTKSDADILNRDVIRFSNMDHDEQAEYENGTFTLKPFTSSMTLIRNEYDRRKDEEWKKAATYTSPRKEHKIVFSDPTKPFRRKLPSARPGPYDRPE